MKESTVTGAAGIQSTSSHSPLQPITETDSKAIDDEVMQVCSVVIVSQSGIPVGFFEFPKNWP